VQLLMRSAGFKATPIPNTLATVSSSEGAKDCVSLAYVDPTTPQSPTAEISLYTR